MSPKSIAKLVLAALFAGAAGVVLWWALPRGGAVTEVEAPPPAPDRWAPLLREETPFQDRLALARSLEASFDLNRLTPWLSRWDDHLASHPVAERDFVVFNEVLEQARLRDYPREDLRAYLLAAGLDADLPPVARDYALQHLALLLEDSRDDSGLILETLCTALEDSSLYGTSIPGTTLNILRDLSQRRPALFEPHRERVARAVAPLLSAPGLSRSLRVTAIQFAGQTGASAHLPALRQLVASPDTEDALAIAAAASLGRLGSREDISALRSLAARGTFASPAARAALSKLQALQE